jgi:hypothetical protein
VRILYHGLTRRWGNKLYAQAIILLE